MSSNPLSTLRPDYDATITALQGLLSDQTAWTDKFPGGIGQTVVGMLSGLTAYQQHEIERFFTEAFPDTALADRSIFTVARMLGIRLRRRISPSITVSLVRPNAVDYLVVPAWTIWSSENVGESFVNVTPIVFDPNEFTVTTVLYAGTVRTASQQMTGQPFARVIVSGSEPFSVSDQHLEFTVNRLLWQPVQNGLWNYGPTSQVAVDSTLGNGDLELRFGNDVYGKMPRNGDIVTVKWLDTKGTRSKISITGTQLTTGMDITANVLGKTTVGGDEHSSTFYRVMGPNLFTSNGQATTVDEYRAIGLTYPGIVDLAVIPQRDLDPYDLRLMNVIHMCPLLANGDVWSREIESPSAPLYIPMELQGQLPAGSYEYRITALNEVGETLPGPSSTVVLPAPGAILLKWPQVTQANAYRVYGRAAGGTLLALAEVKATEFIDNGTVEGTAPLPLSNQTRASWWTFSQWFETRKHSTVKLIYMVPRPVAADVDIRVYVYREVVDHDLIKAQVYEYIKDLFKPRLGTLSRKITRSDIMAVACAIENPVKEGNAIDYVVLDYPTFDFDPGGLTSYMWLRDLRVNVSYTTRAEY